VVPPPLQSSTAPSATASCTVAVGLQGFFTKRPGPVPEVIGELLQALRHAASNAATTNRDSPDDVMVLS
jgi:hypothetical protein